MASLLISNNFTAGELSKPLENRTDYKARKDGARRLINVQPKSYGGVTKRPGIQHVGSLGSTLFRRIHRWDGGETEAFGLAQSADGSWKYFGTEVTPGGVVPVVDVEGFTSAGVTEETQVFTFGNVALISDGGIPHQVDRSGVSTLNDIILVAKTARLTRPTTIINFGSRDFQPNAGTNDVAVTRDIFPRSTDTPGTQPLFPNQRFGFDFWDSDANGTSSASLSVDDVFSRIIFAPHPRNGTPGFTNEYGYAKANTRGSVPHAAFGSCSFSRRSWREGATTRVEAGPILASWNNSGVNTPQGGSGRYFNTADGPGVFLSNPTALQGVFDPRAYIGQEIRLTFTPTVLAANSQVRSVVGTLTYLGFSNGHHSWRVGTSQNMIDAFGTGTNVSNLGVFSFQVVSTITTPAPTTDTNLDLDYMVIVDYSGTDPIEARFSGNVPRDTRSTTKLRFDFQGVEGVEVDAIPNRNLHFTMPNNDTFKDHYIAASSKSVITDSDTAIFTINYGPTLTSAEDKTSQFAAIGALRTGTGGSSSNPVDWIVVYFKGTERYVINGAENGLERYTGNEHTVAALYINNAFDTNTVDFMKDYRRKVLPLLNVRPTTNPARTQKQLQQHTAANLNGALISGNIRVSAREITNPPVNFWASSTEYNAELTRIGGSAYGTTLAAGQKMKWNGSALVTEAITDDDLQVPPGMYTMEWNRADGWYKSVASRDSRLIHGGSSAFPNKLWFSTAEKGSDFQKSYVERAGENVMQRPIDAQVLPDFSFSRLIDGSDPIQNMYSGQSFQVYGRGGEYVMIGNMDAENLSRLEIRRYGSLGSRASVGVIEIDEHTYFFTGDSAIALFYLSDEQGYKAYNLNAQYNDSVFRTYADRFSVNTVDGANQYYWTGSRRHNVVRLAGGNTGNINGGYPVYFLQDTGEMPVFSTSHKANNKQGFFAWSRYIFFQEPLVGDERDAGQDFRYNREGYGMPNGVERKMTDVITVNRATILLDNVGELFFLNPEQTWDDGVGTNGEPTGQQGIPILVETASVQAVELPEQGYVIPHTLQGVSLAFEVVVGDGTMTQARINRGVLNADRHYAENINELRISQTPILFNTDEPGMHYGSGVQSLPGIVAQGNVGYGGNPVTFIIESNTTKPWALSRVESTWQFNSQDTVL